MTSTPYLSSWSRWLKITEQYNLNLLKTLTNIWWFLDLTGILPIDKYPISLYAIHFWYGHV